MKKETCPNCGYCPHCGNAPTNVPVLPQPIWVDPNYWRWRQYPYTPTTPYITITTDGTTPYPADYTMTSSAVN